MLSNLFLLLPVLTIPITLASLAITTGRGCISLRSHINLMKSSKMTIARAFNPDEIELQHKETFAYYLAYLIKPLFHSNPINCYCMYICLACQFESEKNMFKPKPV